MNRLAAAVGVLLLALLAVAAPMSHPAAASTDTAIHVETTHDDPQHVVLILTGGLRWDQLDHDRAPRLSALAASGVTSNLVPISVRGAACPVDSWLALSAGRKVSQRSMADDATCSEPIVVAGAKIPNYERAESALRRQGHTASFGLLSSRLGERGIDIKPIGAGAGYVLANHAGFVPLNYEPAPTLNSELAEMVAASAATHQLTVVDADIESYASDEERIVAQLELEQWIHDQQAAGLNPFDENSGSMPADILDGTEIDPQRQSFAAINILRLERILRHLPARTRVLIASVVGLDTTAYMQLAVAADIVDDASSAGDSEPAGSSPSDEPANARGASTASLPPSFAFSESVRQVGVIQLADIDPTILSWFSAAETTPTGTALKPVDPQPAPCAASETCYTQRLDALTDQALHSGQIQTLRGTVMRYWNVSAALFFVLSLVLLAQPIYRRTLKRPWARLAWSWFGLLISAIPLAALTVNLMHWWRAANPELALFGGSLAFASIFAAVALVTRRLSEVAPLLTIATATAALLCIDAATGSHIMADSPIGFNLLTGARFYGVGNEAYSLIAAGSILALAFLGVWLRDGKRSTLTSDAAQAQAHHAVEGAHSRKAPGGRRILASAVVGVLGMAIAVIDAWPRLGADFGGLLSFLPALCVLLLIIGQVRLTLRRALIIGTGTVVVAFILALVDWMRPPNSRTHLGRFVQSAADGELFDVIARKLGTNLRLLTTTTYRWVVLAAVLLVVLALVRALMRRTEPLAGHTQGSLRARWARLWGYLAPRDGEVSSVGARHPALRPALIAETVCFILAFALNDSGIVLPGVAAILVVPGLLVLVLEAQSRRQ